MEVLLVLIALSIGAFFFFRRNTQRGVDTVRAYVFLSAIKLGRSVDEANAAANYDVANGPAALIQAAMNSVKTQYAGKQLPMIAEAKRLGLLIVHSA